MRSRTLHVIVAWTLLAAMASCLALALVMAVDNTAPELNQGYRTGTVPVSQVTGWVDLIVDTNGSSGPLAAESDAGVVVGGVVVNPGDIVRAAQNRLVVGGHGTTAQIRFAYPYASSGVTGPTVQLFGATPQGAYQRLLDANNLHKETLAPDTVNDVTDGTFYYTQPIFVDVAGSYALLVAINTAASGTSVTGAKIQVRCY